MTTPPASAAPTAPPPGWYADPTNAEQYRWWNGAQWTEHVHPAQPVMPAPTGYVPARSLPPLPWIAAGLVLLVIGVVAAFLVTGGDEADEPAQSAVSAPQGDQAVAEAEDIKEAVLTTQAAIETYATDNSGSYIGVSLPALQAIEPTIPDEMQVTGDVNGYVVTFQMESGATFTLSRSSGTVVHSCDPPGAAGCPPGGDW